MTENEELPDQPPEKYILLDANGMPTGVVDFASLKAAAEHFAYSLAAVAGDIDAVGRIGDEVSADLPSGCGEYVAAAALVVLTQQVIAPLITIAETYRPELDVRANMTELASGYGRAFGGGQ